MSLITGATSVHATRLRFQEMDCSERLDGSLLSAFPLSSAAVGNLLAFGTVRPHLGCTGHSVDGWLKLFPFLIEPWETNLLPWLLPFRELLLAH